MVRLNRSISAGIKCSTRSRSLREIPLVAFMNSSNNIMYSIVPTNVDSLSTPIPLFSSFASVSNVLPAELDRNNRNSRSTPCSSEALTM